MEGRIGSWCRQLPNRLHLHSELQLQPGTVCGVDDLASFAAQREACPVTEGETLSSGRLLQATGEVGLGSGERFEFEPERCEVVN